jgi:hypothetical protein
MKGGTCDLAREHMPFKSAPTLGDVALPRVTGDVAFAKVAGPNGPPVTLTLTRDKGRWGVDFVVGIHLPID